MTVPAELALTDTPLDRLRDPVLVVALRGFFDACGAATDATETLLADRRAVTIGQIDPDPFYDFTVERPTVEIIDDEAGEPQRHIQWPANDVAVVPQGAPAEAADNGRDLIVVSGVEPHLQWGTYIDCLLAALDATGCGLVVTLGAVADATPHSRPPTVIGSTADADLARRFGLAAPSYQGVTGLLGVLHSALEARSVPSISLRVGVPHYLPGAQHPAATASLLRHLGHVTDLRLPAGPTAGEIDHWSQFHRDAVDGDEELTHYVRGLEEHYDADAESTVTSGEDLAAQFEEFLRGNPGNPANPGDDEPDAPDAPSDGDD